MRALVIQPAFLGDVVLATPLVESLEAAGYSVDMLVRKGNEGLLTNNPKLERVLVWDKRTSKYPNLWRLLKQIRRTKYDLVVNPHRYASSGLLTVLSGATTTVGFRQNPLSAFFSQRIAHKFGDGTHEVDRNLDLLGKIGVSGTRSPRLYPSKEDFATTDATTPYVTIAPASVWFTKRYPAEKWVELIKRLPEHLEVHLIGAPGDRELCEAIQVAAARLCRIRAGEQNLLQSAALIAGAQMNYVNDSAPLHLASAMNAPVTAFFLNTTPDFGFGPTNSNGKVRETSRLLECKPCGMTGKRSCPKGHFMCSEIDPEP